MTRNTPRLPQARAASGEPPRGPVRSPKPDRGALGDYASLLAFFRLDEDDLELLRSLRGFAERHTTTIVDRFYEHVLSYPELRRLFVDDASLGRAKSAQRRHFIELFSGDLGPSYLASRRRVGDAHERIGLSPVWYVGAYSEYLRLIEAALAEEVADGEAFARARRSIQKMVFFDVALAMETYTSASLERLAERERAIRELSTPAVRLHDRILLVPLVGALDPTRMEQLAAVALSKAAAEKAKVVLIDVAGVPSIDALVARTLSGTINALALVGAEVILTGISSAMAETMVSVDVRFDGLTTYSQLAVGLERALSIIANS